MIHTASTWLSQVNFDHWMYSLYNNINFKTMNEQTHRSLSDDSSGLNQNIWVLGVILIIIGSLGNNLGNNLVSLDHKQKQKAEDERLKREAKEENDRNANEAKDGDDEEEGNGQQPRRKVDDTNNLVDSLGSTAKDPLISGSGECSNKTLTINHDHTHTNNECDVVVGKPESSRKISYRTIGTITFVIGNLATFASFGFAAQSLLASLESIQFVSNIFFVRYVHKEVVTWRMVIATASIVIGNTLVVIFSDHAANLLTSAMLLQLYATNEAYWVYLGVALCLWAIHHFTYAHYYHMRVKKNTLLWKHGFIEPFAYAVSSAIIGTQAVLQSKCMSMLIQVSSRGIVNEFKLPHIWWILVTWIILVAYWLRRLDKGLELFPPLFIIPVLQVFFVFFAILCGGIYFEEFVAFTYSQYIGFVIGVMMILGGVYGLAPNDLEIITPTKDQNLSQSVNAAESNMQSSASQSVFNNSEANRSGNQSGNQSVYQSVYPSASASQKLNFELDNPFVGELNRVPSATKLLTAAADSLQPLTMTPRSRAVLGLTHPVDNADATSTVADHSPVRTKPHPQPIAASPPVFGTPPPASLNHGSNYCSPRVKIVTQTTELDNYAARSDTIINKNMQSDVELGPQKIIEISTMTMLTNTDSSSAAATVPSPQRQPTVEDPSGPLPIVRLTVRRQNPTELSVDDGTKSSIMMKVSEETKL